MGTDKADVDIGSDGGKAASGVEKQDVAAATSGCGFNDGTNVMESNGGNSDEKGVCFCTLCHCCNSNPCLN